MTLWGNSQKQQPENGTLESIAITGRIMKIQVSVPHNSCSFWFSGPREIQEFWFPKKWKQWQILFSWAPKSLQTVTAAMKLEDTCFLEEKIWQPRQHIKKKIHHFANKGPYSQIYGLSSSHVRMWELDHNEGWAPKNWCFWTVVLEKPLESPLDCKEIKPVNPKGNQPWIFIGRTDAEAEALILWPPDASSWPFGKTLMLGKIEGKRRRGQLGMRWLVASLTQQMWVWANSGR